MTVSDNSSLESIAGYHRETKLPLAEIETEVYSETRNIAIKTGSAKSAYLLATADAYKSYAIRPHASP